WRLPNRGKSLSDGQRRSLDLVIINERSPSETPWLVQEGRHATVAGLAPLPRLSGNWRPPPGSEVRFYNGAESKFMHDAILGRRDALNDHSRHGLRPHVVGSRLSTESVITAAWINRRDLDSNLPCLFDQALGEAMQRVLHCGVNRVILHARERD